MVKFVVIICGNFKVEKEELASAEAFGERVKLYFSIFLQIDHVPVASNVSTYQQLQNNHAREYTQYIIETKIYTRY